MTWDGQIPDLTPLGGAGAAGAVVLGGVWEDEPAAVQALEAKAATQKALLENESG